VTVPRMLPYTAWPNATGVYIVNANATTAIATENTAHLLFITEFLRIISHLTDHNLFCAAESRPSEQTLL